MGNCKICNKHFGLFHWKYRCGICENFVCRDCKENLNIGYYKKRLYLDLKILNNSSDCICKNCQEVYRYKVSQINGYENVRVISHNYKGRLPQFTESKEICSNWYTDKIDAEEELQKIAHFFGYDCVIHKRLDKGTGSETTENGKGTYYYSIWRASGVAVKVLNKQKRSNKNYKL